VRKYTTIGSHNMNERLIYKLLESEQTVFSINEIAIIGEETDAVNLKNKINYYTKSGLLLNIRKGFYAKRNYNIEEFACKLYAPTYISLEYVLQKEGVVFQYSSEITSVSNLSRVITVDKFKIKYRKVKDSLLLNPLGIRRLENGINIATPERALLDSLYLNKSGYFDNTARLDFDLIKKMLEIYQSKAFLQLYNKTIKHV